MKFVNIPKDGTSDTQARLIEICKADGNKVYKGDILCEIETSKAIIEIESKFEGYIYFCTVEN